MKVGQRSLTRYRVYSSIFPVTTLSVSLNHQCRFLSTIREVDVSIDVFTHNYKCRVSISVVVCLFQFSSYLQAAFFEKFSKLFCDNALCEFFVGFKSASCKTCFFKWHIVV